MAYDKFTTLKSTAVPLPIENVDTDQIIPARFLKATERKGFGDNLFRDWRYNQDNTPKEDFVLNDSTYSGKILVGGKNFGSGSSREHAAWAVYDYGFRCVISSFFADIFRGNCLNIGVLPVQVSAEFLQKIFVEIEKNPNTEIEVSLQEQKVTILETGELGSFDNVRRASDIAMHAGSDFIKTSTGKISPAATLPVTLVMLEAIKDYYYETGVQIGMKPAGGISNSKLALQYLMLVKETLGDKWLTNQWFRFGASSLANDLLMQLEKQRSGNYQSKDYFSKD